MKRNFVVGIFGGLIGSAMLLIVLSATGVVGARGAEVRSDVSHVNAVAAATLTSTFTYEGQLISSGSPVSNTCDFQFSLYDALNAGGRIGITQTLSSVSVSHGLFAALLNAGDEFGDTAFNGDARWLSIGVRCPAGGGGYTGLSPRQQLTSLPFALPGLRTFPNASSPNIVGGFSGNTITGGAVGSIIGGGGASGDVNTITNSWAFIGGGANNIARGLLSTIGGGANNQANGDRATVGGGYNNQANGNSSTIGGGRVNTTSGQGSTIGGGGYDGTNFFGNQATGNASTVGGGIANYANGHAATIGGGLGNTANGQYSIIPGGSNNLAQGDHSFAAGRGAKANHQGVFVWADSTAADINSSDSDQFIVRANGGIAFVTSTVNFTPTIDAGVFITTSTGAYLSTSGVWTLGGAKFADGTTQTTAFYRPNLPGPGAAATVDSAGDVGQYTSITIGTDGLGLISYRDATNSYLKVLHCGNAACNGGNNVTTVDSAGIVGWYTSITIGADGLGLISYQDGSTDGDLKVFHCGNAACNSGTATTVDSAGAVGGYTSITIGADGLGLISYIDNTTDGDLKVLHCGNTVCSSGTATTVDSAGNVGEFSSLTIGADGLGLISYYDSTNGDLKVLHCGNAACAGGSNISTTVDSTGNVGDYPSITIGADGRGLISYYDQTNGNLKVYHCGNAACNGVNISTTVDSAGDVGYFTSITIGADGLGLISYEDATNFDMKVFRCSNLTCTPYTRVGR